MYYGLLYLCPQYDFSHSYSPYFSFFFYFKEKKKFMLTIVINLYSWKKDMIPQVIKFCVTFAPSRQLSICDARLEALVRVQW